MASKSFEWMYKQLLQPKDERNRVPFPKLPRVLLRNAVHALNRAQRMAAFFHGEEADVSELLSKYRAYMSEWPRSPLHPPVDQELMPFLKKLDEAFQAIHSYKPEDYFSEGVYQMAQSRNRGKGVPWGEIDSFLRTHDYLNLPRGKKGDIKKEAIQRFGISSRSFDEAVAKLKK